jgi:hypothetical protein
MHDGPGTRIAFTEENHARFRLQARVEPCQRVRAVSGYFDLNDLGHYDFAAMKMPRDSPHLMVAGEPSISCDMSHAHL